MIKLVLRLFDLFRRPIEGLGVAYAQFRAILEVKLMMDNRRQSGAFQRGRDAGKPQRTTFVITLAVYAFFGAFVGSAVLVVPSPLLAMTLIHSFVMAMVGMTLIADFSTVLLDTTDNAVLQPRPVAGRTILVARVAHIVVYLSSMALALSLASMFLGAIRFHPLMPIVFVGTLACSLCLIVFVANAFYLITMRLVSAERLRDMITWMQIVMTVVVIGGYQILPRLIGMQRLVSISLDDAIWVYFYPPAWMAAPIDLLAGHVDRMQIILTIEGVVIPIAALVAVVRFLAPTFNRSMLALESQPAAVRDVRPEGPARNTLPARLARWTCRGPVQQAAFEMIWRLCGRDRQFKRRTYPSIAMLGIMCALFIFQGGFGDRAGGRHAIASLRDSNFFLFILYLPFMVVPAAIAQVVLTDQPDAAWIYRLLPMERPGLVVVAAWKVIMARLIVPAHAVVAAVLLVVCGSRIVLDVAVAFCAMLLLCAVFGLSFLRRFPFSQPYSVMQESGRMVRSFVIMFVPFVLGGLHFLIRSTFPLGLPVLIPVYLALTAVALYGLASKSGDDLLG